MFYLNIEHHVAISWMFIISYTAIKSTIWMLQQYAMFVFLYSNTNMAKQICNYGNSKFKASYLFQTIISVRVLFRLIISDHEE